MMAASDRHTELCNMAARWICNRSFKICGVPEADAVGYIADFVAIAGMHNEHHTRYAKHSGVEKRYVTYGRDKIHGVIDRWYVCVFEVKISRSDFLNTFGNNNSPHAKARAYPVGTAHWVVAEKGICNTEELPDFWGLLEPYGTGLTEKKWPKLNVLSDPTLHAIAFRMLWLQMNYRTSYFDQIIGMSETIGKVHRAIINDKPKEALLFLSNRAVKACQGFVEAE